jgi:hypothetical protein
VGQQLNGKLQGGLVDGDEQVLLQRVVLVAARPPVEPADGGTHGWSAVQEALGSEQPCPVAEAVLEVALEFQQHRGLRSGG